MADDRLQNHRKVSEMGREDFIAVFGHIYEKSPWIVEQAWDQGLASTEDSPEGLCRTLATIVEEAGPELQLRLLRAHPDLAGKLGVGDVLTTESRSEQAGAGLDRCTKAEYAEFQSLNQSYTKQFGFPFILAVRGRNRQQVLENFRDRIDSGRDDEFAEALRQVHRIAWLRLQEIECYN